MKTKPITTAIAVILLACNSYLQAKDAPLELIAGNTRIENGVSIAEDNAHIKYDGITIQADKIEYNPKTGEARLFKKAGSQATLLATLQLNREK